MKLCECGHGKGGHVSEIGACNECGCYCRQYREREWVMLDENQMTPKQAKLVRELVEAVEWLLPMVDPDRCTGEYRLASETLAKAKGI